MTLRVHPDEIVERSSSGLLGTHPSWERVRLGEIAEVLNGFPFKSSLFSRDEGVPLIRIRDVGSSESDTRYAGDFDPMYLVEPRSVVIGMDGDFRVARWRGEPALLNQRVCKVTARDAAAFDEGFLFYVLPGYLDEINRHTSSVTVKHLSSNTVKEIPVPLPPLAEQQRIVAAVEEHLSRLDAADRSLTVATHRLRALRRAVLRASFSVSAPVAALGDVALLTDGPFGSNLKTSHYTASGPRVIRLQNIGDGVFRDEFAHVSEQHFASLRKHEVVAGDIVAASLGETAPRACRIPPSVGAAIVKADCIRIRPRSNIDPLYLMWYLNSPQAKDEAASRIKGVGRPRLGLGGMKVLRIPLPSLDEQRTITMDIEQRVSAATSLLAVLSNAQHRSAALRRAILTCAFRGELARQGPADEPAFVLLQRIRASRAATPSKGRRASV